MMSEVEKKAEEVDIKQDATQPDNKWFNKKEKRVDYQNTDVKVKERQETVIEKNTVTVYNPSTLIIEIDLGSDKSVRLAPYTSVELEREYLEYPGFQTIKGLIKIH